MPRKPREKFEPAPHIKYLIQCEDQERDISFMWGRTGKDHDVLWISSVGYEHRGLWAIEAELIKEYGLYYAFDHMREHNMFGCHQWDKQCGRTFIYLQEPVRCTRCDLRVVGKPDLGAHRGGKFPLSHLHNSFTLFWYFERERREGWAPKRRFPRSGYNEKTSSTNFNRERE